MKMVFEYVGGPEDGVVHDHECECYSHFPGDVFTVEDSKARVLSRYQVDEILREDPPRFVLVFVGCERMKAGA